MAERIPKTDYEVTKRMLVVEMVGTWGIAYCGGLLVIAADEKKMDLTAVAIGHTFVVAFFVWAAAGISGAHINGAVSLAFWITGAISPKKFWLYTLAQMVGSLLAGVMLRVYLWNDKKYGNSLGRWPSSLGYPHADLVNWDTSTCFIMETLGTFFLVGTVFLTAFNSTRPKSDVYGFCIGAMVGVWILMIGPITGCSLNPQRVLGPAIVSGELFEEEYNYAYIYYVGNYLGGAIFGIVWWFFFADWNKNELKYSAEVRQDSDVEEVHDKLAPKEAWKEQDCYINGNYHFFPTKKIRTQRKSRFQ
jgi:aquaporin NIP